MAPYGTVDPLEKIIEEPIMNANVGAEIISGLGLEVGGSVLVKRTSSVVLTGYKSMKGNAVYQPNVVNWIITENSIHKVGVPPYLQTAILLERRTDEIFKANVNVKAELSTNFIRMMMHRNQSHKRIERGNKPSSSSRDLRISTPFYGIGFWSLLLYPVVDSNVTGDSRKLSGAIHADAGADLRRIFNDLFRSHYESPLSAFNSIQTDVGMVDEKLLREFEEESKLDDANIESLPGKIESQRNVLYNLITQHDRYLQARLARESLRDSKAMKTLSILTILFLPGAFIATIFSTNMFDFTFKNQQVGI
ncbi:Mg2+ transporter, -like Zinc transport [Fusarium agapanthi]|uniref:Mg2+ transporter, -like Zinc transport n=1 Tax=Fusarium agapanthi TaxID=1803897 RepID=A0A9P5BH31_9HYPO|nr:Mg2+ transporter, -like Zinc transport [Fusarium agapanthi]